MTWSIFKARRTIAEQEAKLAAAIPKAEKWDREMMLRGMRQDRRRAKSEATKIPDRMVCSAFMGENFSKLRAEMLNRPANVNSVAPAETSEDCA